MKIYKVKVNGKVYEVEIESVTEKEGSIEVNDAPVTSSGETKEVKSPMAGNILEVKVQVGTKVAKGQVVAILEAMKLENEVVSEVDGVVKQILVNKGQTVTMGQVLVIVG